MKLLDILQELEKPKKIYADRQPGKEITIKDLTPEEYEELIQKGSIMVPLSQDPNRPETVGSQVLYLPKIDQVKREIINNKKEFDVFTQSKNKDIKEIATQINKLHNSLFKSMDILDKLLKLQKQGRI
jgi:hypothetical protein